MSTAVAERQDQAPANVEPHPATDSTALLAMIERAARDPGVDIDKFERLMKLQERVIISNAEEAFNDAMAQAQEEMTPIAADSNNPQTRSKYASYAALDRVVRPIYSKHGLALSYNTGEAKKPEDVRVICLATRGRYTREYYVDMPADGKGAKGGDVMTKTHATGSALSYGQRYLLGLIFNLAVSGKREDDGNGAGATAFITEPQVEELKSLIAAAVKSKPNTVEADWLTTFLEFMKVDGLNFIPAKQFAKARSAIIDATQKTEAK